MKATSTLLRTLAAGLFLVSGYALAADTNADGASVVQTMSKAKGLIVRAPINDKGEVDTSGAEYRLDLGTTAVNSQEALPTAFDQGQDVKGFAEVSKPATESKDASTCYYYQPYVYYNTYYWNFSYPVYTYYYYYTPVYYYQPVTYVYYYYYIVY